MTDIEALRARMREAAEKAMAATSDNWFHGEYSDIEYAPPAGDENGAHWFPLADELAPAVCDYLIAAQPSATIALDAYTTRLREDLDRVTRERDEARADAASWQAQAQRVAQDAVEFGTRAESAEAALAKRDEEVARLRGVLTRCRTILGNMAKENEGAIFCRWPISHEPLRADARHLLPIIDEALTKEPTNA